MSWSGAPIQASTIRFPVHGNCRCTELLASTTALCWTRMTRIPAGGALPELPAFRAIATLVKFCDGDIPRAGVMLAAEVCTWYCAALASCVSALSSCQGLAPCVQELIGFDEESSTAYW